MKLYTIGFTKKTAKEFFDLLIKNEIKTIIDIRRKNNSQLAGFTKENDLKYFLKKISNINYIYLIDFAPNQELLKKYREKKINWNQFEQKYMNQINDLNLWKNLDIDSFKDGCLLCSEPSPERCHRRLLAEVLLNKYVDKSIQIIHL